MTNELKVAFISGPAYDALYECLPAFTAATGVEVDVKFQGDHPTLNRHLAGLADVPYDLVSTHTKYAPSQRQFLAALDEVIEPSVTEDFVPLILELARVDGSLLGMPRNIDVRLLHYRTDLIESPPRTWDDLLALAREKNSPPDHYGFIFPGRESGLFGAFYELAEMAGASLFPENLVPEIENDGGRWALSLLREFYQEGLTPRELPEWHYDKVHECFRAGHAVMVGDWPGYYSLYRNADISKVHDRFAVCSYPIGPAGTSLAYGGGHTFALTRKGINRPEAVNLLLHLTEFAQQMNEARQGCVPVRRSVMQAMQGEADETNRERLQMLEKVISDHILIPPKFARYPEVEDVIWRTIQKAIIGETEVDKALNQITEQIEGIVQRENNDNVNLNVAGFR
ncbi:MAG TPA: extracellular solute-binding protein [Pyrinomonadaceae bacterium]|nr:extracellular solute-binding protein [Pyrinomonadaceae bacterium]